MDLLFLKTHFGDLLSILGILVAIIGFYITINNVIISKEEVLKARDDIFSIKTITEFSEVIKTMEETNRFQSDSKWELLQFRYPEIRKTLRNIKVLNPTLSEGQKTKIQNTIVNLRNIELKVCEANRLKRKPTNIKQLTIIISDDIDSMHEVFLEIKSIIGKVA